MLCSHCTCPCRQLHEWRSSSFRPTFPGMASVSQAALQLVRGHLDGLCSCSASAGSHCSTSEGPAGGVGRWGGETAIQPSWSPAAAPDSCCAPCPPSTCTSALTFAASSGVTCLSFWSPCVLVFLHLLLLQQILQLFHMCLQLSPSSQGLLPLLLGRSSALQLHLWQFCHPELLASLGVTETRGRSRSSPFSCFRLHVL